MNRQDNYNYTALRDELIIATIPYYLTEKSDATLSVCQLMSESKALKILS